MPDAFGALSPAETITILAALTVLGVIAYAGVRDVFTFIIPDWVSIVVVAGFVVAAPAVGLSWGLVGQHVLAAVMVFTAGALMFHYGVMGGGDVKLLTAIALWAGLAGSLMLLVLVSLFGGVLTLAVIIIHRLRRRPAGTAVPEPPKVPYGVAIAAGALTIFLAFPLAAGDVLKPAALLLAGIGG